MSAPVSSVAPDGPKGLGGWLILPIVGLVLLPINMLLTLYTDYLPIFGKGLWPVLTTPGGAAYHPLWAPLLVTEIGGNFFFIGFALLLLLLCFRKSPRFPRLYIAFMVANLVFVVVDTVLGNQIPAVGEQGTGWTSLAIGRALLGCAIWIPYMLKSERVRNTFGGPDH